MSHFLIKYKKYFIWFFCLVILNSYGFLTNTFIEKEFKDFDIYCKGGQRKSRVYLQTEDYPRLWSYRSFRQSECENRIKKVSNNYSVFIIFEESRGGIKLLKTSESVVLDNNDYWSFWILSFFGAYSMGCIFIFYASRGIKRVQNRKQ